MAEKAENRRRLRPIVIEGAMDSELNVILRAIAPGESAELSGYQVWEGTVDGYPVVAARNMIGMVNAAVLTASLIRAYDPLFVITEGTAGGYCPDVHTGDIILGERAVNINSFSMRYEDCRKLEEISLGEWHDGPSAASTEKLLRIAEATAYADGRILRGCVASADFWSFRPESIRDIMRRYSAVCEEMESYAVMKACERMNTDCLCVRVISNNETTGEIFSPETAEAVQIFTLQVIRNVLKTV